MQKVLHVQSVHSVLLVLLDDLVRDEKRLMCIGRSEPVNGETSRQTRDRSKERLERLGQMVRDEVLIDLHSVFHLRSANMRFHWQDDV